MPIELDLVATQEPGVVEVVEAVLEVGIGCGRRCGRWRYLKGLKGQKEAWEST